MINFTLTMVRKARQVRDRVRGLKLPRAVAALFILTMLISAIPAAARWTIPGSRILEKTDVLHKRDMSNAVLISDEYGEVIYHINGHVEVIELPEDFRGVLQRLRIEQGLNEIVFVLSYGNLVQIDKNEIGQLNKKAKNKKKKKLKYRSGGPGSCDPKGSGEG